MKVLLVSHSQKAGGAEKCLVEAAVALQGRGFDVLTLLPTEGPLSEALKINSIPFLTAPFPWWVHFERTHPTFLQRVRRCLSTIWYSMKLFKLMRRVNPDVVVSNTLCVGSAALACKVLGKKHVWFIHEYGREDHGLVFDLGFYVSSKIISSTANDILVNSTGVRDKFSKFIPLHKFSIVSYDIPLPETSTPLKYSLGLGNSFNLLLVGQISSNKGQMDAIQALEILLKKGRHGKLHIVGQVADESYAKMIHTFVRARKMEDKVEIRSHSKQPFNVIPENCIGLMCSEWEALGRVTIEYMKLGIPVIGANAGTTAKLINHDYNGLLYSLRNPQNLADQIEYLLNDGGGTVARITENAKVFASATFNTDNFVKGLVSRLA